MCFSPDLPSSASQLPPFTAISSRIAGAVVARINPKEGQQTRTPQSLARCERIAYALGAPVWQAGSQLHQTHRDGPPQVSRATHTLKLTVAFGIRS
jgi:hypothetical protein